MYISSSLNKPASTLSDSLKSIIYGISEASLKNLFGEKKEKINSEKMKNFSHIICRSVRFQITGTEWCVVEGIGENGNENNYNIESGYDGVISIINIEAIFLGSEHKNSFRRLFFARIFASFAFILRR